MRFYAVTIRNNGKIEVMYIIMKAATALGKAAAAMELSAKI